MSLRQVIQKSLKRRVFRCLNRTKGRKGIGVVRDIYNGTVRHRTGV